MKDCEIDESFDGYSFILPEADPTDGSIVFEDSFFSFSDKVKPSFALNLASETKNIIFKNTTF